MPSIAHHQFPQFVFRDGKKLLWNPILKRTYANLPEERVRLQIVEYLLNAAEFSASRISFESPVNLPRDKSSSRTDLICFDKDFEALLLVECKAPSILLNEKTSLQIARYNQKINAPFLLITNGIQDYWFYFDGDKLSNLTIIPSEFESKSEPLLHFDYWASHGFAGKKSHPNTRNWITDSCIFLYQTANNPNLAYFKFKGSPPDLYMPNYYRVHEESTSKKMAISLTSTPFGATKMNIVLNKNGINTTLLSCSLDLLAANESANTIFLTEKGEEILDLTKEASFTLKTPLENSYKSILSMLMNY